MELSGGLRTDVNVPILDEPITSTQVEQQAKLMKSDKARGLDGVSPGIFKVLPVSWILIITSLFNNIFSSGVYPQSWARAKLFIIFKKEDRSSARNYRGINIINSLAKLYGMALCSRLKLWFRPYREQAGAQAKRGCPEHIASLRLCDMARRKKLTFYVTFVVFSQAYDMVSRKIV